MTDIVERLRGYAKNCGGPPEEYLSWQAADEIERLREAHERIVEWSRAYPLGVFPKPDLKRAHELLQAGGMTLDAISADAMRHVIEQVAKISRAAFGAEAMTREPCHPVYSAEICQRDELRAEVERLQADIDHLMAERQGWLDEIERCREEQRAVLRHVEELRADKIKLMALLAEARGPEDETHERVAEWLRTKGYSVEPKP